MTRNAAGTRRLAQAAVAAGVALALCCGFWSAPALAVGELSSRESRDDISAGTAYMERCMFEEAVAAFSRAVKADLEGVQAARAYDCLGYLYWCRGWNSEAEKAFGESLRRARDARSRLRARLALGQVLLDLGRTGEACSELDEALKLAEDQDRDIVYTLLGVAKFEAGDTTAAVEMFSRALEAFPENPVARSYLQRLSFGMQLHLPSAKTAPAGGATGSDKTSGAVGQSGTPAGVGPGTSGGAQALQGVVFVNSGAVYTIAPHVTLTLGMTMPVPVRGFFLAAGDDAFRWHDWRSPMIEWRLRGEGDGKKPVKVVYYSPEPRAAITAEASIALDREPPWGSLEVNEGRQYTNSTRVTLCLSAGDRTSGILNVSASND
ncbi:MAG: tetratricopeptide repeat protein, partial [Bacillota bacterium]